MPDVTKGLNMKIQKHFFKDIKHNSTPIQNFDLYVKALLSEVPEAYLEPSQTHTMRCFSGNS